MKIKPDPNCAMCKGTGEVFDWVDYGSTIVKLPSLCECVEAQMTGFGPVELDLSDLQPYSDYDDKEEWEK